ncbi:MAG: STY4526/YPO1902 family pathogenicity island replication protein [Gammaproteobacteria bacterium]
MKLIRESELNFAILRYALVCLREGDIEMLDELGFKRDDIEAIKNFTLVDIMQMSNLPSPLLKRDIIDRDCLWRAIEHVNTTRQHQSALEELLRSDAPLTMMHTLCGMTSTEYADLRRLHGVAGGAGRTREAREEEIQAVWSTYKSQVADVDRMTPNDWIELKQRLDGVPLRIVWQLIQDWAQDASR